MRVCGSAILTHKYYQYVLKKEKQEQEYAGEKRGVVDISNIPQ